MTKQLKNFLWMIFLTNSWVFSETNNNDNNSMINIKKQPNKDNDKLRNNYLKKSKINFNEMLEEMVTVLNFVFLDINVDYLNMDYLEKDKKKYDEILTIFKQLVKNHIRIQFIPMDIFEPEFQSIILGLINFFRINSLITEEDMNNYKNPEIFDKNYHGKYILPNETKVQIAKETINKDLNIINKVKNYFHNVKNEKYNITIDSIDFSLAYRSGAIRASDRFSIYSFNSKSDSCFVLLHCKIIGNINFHNKKKFFFKYKTGIHLNLYYKINEFITVKLVIKEFSQFKLSRIVLYKEQEKILDINLTYEEQAINTIYEGQVKNEFNIDIVDINKYNETLTIKRYIEKQKTPKKNKIFPKIIRSLDPKNKIEIQSFQKNIDPINKFFQQISNEFYQQISNEFYKKTHSEFKKKKFKKKKLNKN